MVVVDDVDEELVDEVVELVELVDVEVDELVDDVLVDAGGAAVVLELLVVDELGLVELVAATLVVVEATVDVVVPPPPETSVVVGKQSAAAAADPFGVHVVRANATMRPTPSPSRRRRTVIATKSNPPTMHSVATVRVETNPAPV